MQNIHELIGLIKGIDFDEVINEQETEELASWVNKNRNFANTKEGKWVFEHCAEYGFIIRYPEGKEDITGYQFEPWHLRYVGKKVAKEIMEEGITLEEYLGKTH